MIDDDYNFLKDDDLGDLPGPSRTGVEKIVESALEFDGECVNLNESGLGDSLIE